MSASDRFWMALGIYLVGLPLVSLIMVIPTWFAFNHAVAPYFGWEHLGFWQTLGFLWVSSLVSAYVRGLGTEASFFAGKNAR